MSMKNYNDTIGNRTRDLPTCSTVPQPTALPRAPRNCRRLLLQLITLIDTYLLWQLWMSVQPIAETSTWQRSQETDIHVPGGIQTRNPSKREATDPHLRQRDHIDFTVYISVGNYSLPCTVGMAVPSKGKCESVIKMCCVTTIQGMLLSLTEICSDKTAATRRPNI